MAKYRKRPVVIEAERWFQLGDVDDVYTIDRSFQPIGNCENCNKRIEEHGRIDTLEGDTHIVCPGDWIITDIKGKKYPCKPDIFEKTYEPV